MSWGSGASGTGGSRSQQRICSPLFSIADLNEGLLIPWLQVRVLRGSLPVVPLRFVRFWKEDAGSRAAFWLRPGRPCFLCHYLVA